MNKTLVVMAALGALAVQSIAHAEGDVTRGKAAVEKYACASCHGADMKTPIDPTYPRLAGQQYDYLVQSLRAYKNPDNRTYGRNHAMMKGMAAPLSTQDVDDIAAYTSHLPGTLVTQR
ncbi:c-type cytochrome [soil metagenome]